MFSQANSRLDSFAAVVTQRSSPLVDERCLTTLITAARETNLSHATMSLCAGESETAGSFSGSLRGRACYVKAEGNSRLVISPVKSPVKWGGGGGAVPGRDLTLLNIFKFLKLG